MFTIIMSVTIAVVGEADIAGQIVAHRLNLTSGELVIRVDTNRSQKTLADEYRIAWQGNAQCQSHLFRLHPNPIWNGMRDLWGVSKEGRVEWTDLRAANKKIAAAITPQKSRSPTIDPRAIGIATRLFELLSHFDMKGWSATVDAKRSWVVSSTRPGIATLSDDDAGGRTVYTADLKKGPNIIAVEKNIVRANEKLKLTLAVDLQFHPLTDTWLPKSTWYKCFESGSLVEEERCEVEIVSFNQLIPEERFGIAGFGLPVGWRVHDKREANSIKDYIWDGSKLVALDQGAEPTLASTPPSRRNYVLFGFSLILAMVGGYLLWRWWNTP